MVDVRSLPASLTPFVGRDAELTEIGRRLSDPNCRLLTLIGPGGIGKTRLAIEAASRQVNKFPDGIWFVELQPVTSPDHMVPAIASAIDFDFYDTDSPEEQLLQYLHGKRLLVVLDNVEHLLSDTLLVTRILKNAAGVRVLATSREALNLQEEWIYPVSGLSFPATHEHYRSGYDAVLLFDACAQRASYRFSLESDWPQVARICRLVEGNPLALELAATWLKTLSCRAVAEQIERDLDFLVSPLRNVPDRHRSMRTVFEQSWAMLSHEEKTVFMKLTVFRGGCTDQAARQVTEASLSTLSALIDKSFVRKVEPERYTVHELLRQFGAEHLEQSGQTAPARDNHSDYYLKLLREREADIKGNRQLAALDEIESEFENIRAAWEWAVERQHILPIHAASESLYWFCVSRNRLREGAELLRKAFAQPPDMLEPSAIRQRGRLLARYVGLLSLGYIQDEDATTQLEESLNIAQRYDDQIGIAFCLMVSGETAMKAGKYGAALSLYQRALAHYRQHKDRFYMVRTLERICWTSMVAGNPSESAIEAAREGLSIARAIGDQVGAANCQYLLGGALGATGHYEEYKTAYRETLALRREIGEQAGIALNLGGLAYAEFFAGNFRETVSFASEALAIASGLNHVEAKCQALNLLGHVACMEESYVESRRMLEESRRFAIDPYRASTAELGLAMVAFAESDYGSTRAHLRTAVALLTYRPHYKVFHYLLVMTLAEVADGHATRGLELLALLNEQSRHVVGFISKWPLISRLQADLRATLGDDAFVSAWERGKTLNFGPTAAEMFVYFSPERHDRTLSPSPSVPEPLRSANRALAVPLTDREHEILLLIAEGLSNQEIADRLFLAVSTVKRHINHCYGKLSVTSRAQAILKAQQLRLA